MFTNYLVIYSPDSSNKFKVGFKEVHIPERLKSKEKGKKKTQCRER